MLAGGGYAFMVAWESMALTSFFHLVHLEHRHAEIRRAGYLYLLIAHIGAVGILRWRHGRQRGGLHFRCHARFLPSGHPWPSAAFLLALFGFGARPACYRYTSGCLRRGPGAVTGLGDDERVMLKTAIYGLHVSDNCCTLNSGGGVRSCWSSVYAGAAA